MKTRERINFQRIFLNGMFSLLLSSQNWHRSSMDRIEVSYTFDAGSIPAGVTKAAITGCFFIGNNLRYLAQKQKIPFGFAKGDFCLMYL